jgi:hypothetical protein
MLMSVLLAAVALLCRAVYYIVDHVATTAKSQEIKADKGDRA